MVQTLARDAKVDLEKQNQYAERRLLVERKLGGVLRQMDKATGAQGQLAGRDFSGGSTMLPPENSVPTYAELGTVA